MLREGKEGTVDLKKLYKELNSEYFGGACPSSIKLGWSGRLKNAVGQAYVRYEGELQKRRKFDNWIPEIPVADVSILTETLRIHISKTFDLSSNDIKAVMLHEMVHILLFSKRKVGGHHSTPEFDGWINKLRDQSGLEVPFKESSFKKSPKLKAKEGYILVVYQTDGKLGLTMYSQKFLLKKWMLFAEAYARWPNRSSKVSKIEMYKAKHSIVSSKGALRSIKFQWMNVDEETVREIKKTGKLFLWGDTQGMTIHPIVFGENKYMVKRGEKVSFDNKGQITDVV